MIIVLMLFAFLMSLVIEYFERVAGKDNPGMQEEKSLVRKKINRKIR